MMRVWLCVAMVVVCLSILGCESDSRESIIRDTNNQVSAVANSINSIKVNLEDFLAKKKAGNDEEAAKKSLALAVDEANKLKQIAKAMQQLGTRVNGLPPLTAEEKKANLQTNRASIDRNREDVIKAHQEMKTVLDDAKAKYADSLNDLTKAFSEAESEFAAIVRKR